MPRSSRSDSSTLFGWYMYDWANSAYAVTIIGALFGPFLSRVIVPAGGVDIPLLGMQGVSATSLYGYSIGISAFLVLLTSPILGAIADHTASKRTFLMFFCTMGSVSTTLLFFTGPGDVVPALVLFVVSYFCFVSGNVFYDAFLPHIAADQEQDEVSGRGFAYGYAGGGLQFLLSVLFIQFHEQLGVADPSLAVRIAMAAAGLWWGAFSIITFRLVREPVVVFQHVPRHTAVLEGVRSVFRVLGHVRSMRQLVVFLLAFMVYNDGIQTVITMATIYGAEELGFETSFMMISFLLVQFVGILGSWAFARLSDRIGTKSTVLISLVIWCGIVVCSYFITIPMHFLILSLAVGLVLGGSQALSRSLFSRMIPSSASAEFFGFFSVFEKFSAIGGPLLFAIVRQVTGSARNSILALIGFFIVGIVLLLFLNVEAAVRDRDLLEEKMRAGSV